MIIGNGLIANGFLDRQIDHSKYIIFASGVSNSNETNPEEFAREKKLLLATIEKYPKLKLIYFTSVLAGKVLNPYYNHKFEMEKLIRANTNDFIIFMLPQVVGKLGNSANLVNYIVNKVKTDEPIEIHYGIDRSIIDIDDVISIVNYCLDKANHTTLMMSGISCISVLDLSLKVGYKLKKNINLIINYKHKSLNWNFKNDTLIKKAMSELNLVYLYYVDKLIEKYIK